MPKIDIAAVPERKGSPYPPPFDAPCAERVRQRLGNAGGLTDFGVNLMRLPPGNWSSQRHWAFGRRRIRLCARRRTDADRGWRRDGAACRRLRGLSKGYANGHHLINKSGAMAVYLEVGSRSPADVTICSDVDMMSSNADGRFVHKDGTPYRSRREAPN